MMAWGKIDDAQFQEFADRAKGKIESESLKQSILKSTRRVRTFGMREVKSLTPVDSGHLRRVWHFDEPSIVGLTIVMNIYNNADYASYVESGHRQTPGRYVPAIGKKLKASWVPGNHMLMSTLFEIDAQMPNLLTPEFNKAMEELFR